MTIDEFEKQAHSMVDFMVDYLRNIEGFPVKSQVSPRQIYDALPPQPPQDAESMDDIMSDFKTTILPGITHWQSPYFHAYFPGNSSYPSLLAEMLTATMGAQCMIWETSPAAAELEQMVMEWLRDAMTLPSDWEGVIQDTASTATLCALISAREKYTNFDVNNEGFGNHRLRVYCSTETHSSIEKGVKIAGIGKNNLTKISVDENNAMNPRELEDRIREDIKNGVKPICVVAALGTTGTTAVDPILELSRICKEYDVWLHIDAAYAGSALILPEYQHLIQGIADADSFVFNPHKWLMTNFDCTAYYVKDRSYLVNSFSITPEYLKTNTQGQVNDYRDWGVPLGRRFRALKLWFVIRNYGIKGLQKVLRSHMALAKWLEGEVLTHPDFEMMAPMNFNLVCFRWNPGGKDEAFLEKGNKAIIDEVNASGMAYLTHTKVKGDYVIRVVIGQTYVEKRHVERTWTLIREASAKI